jgi:hypothetical protein
MCLVCCCCCCCMRAAKKTARESVCPCALMYIFRSIVRPKMNSLRQSPLGALTFNYSSLTISFDLVGTINARKIIIANFRWFIPRRCNGFFNLFKLHACSVCVCARATFVLPLMWPHRENTRLLFSRGLLVVTSGSDPLPPDFCFYFRQRTPD